MKTILIIEDEPTVAEVLKAAVEGGIPGAACVVELDFGKSAARIAELQPEFGNLFWT